VLPALRTGAQHIERSLGVRTVTETAGSP
jgi:hypothetical protein